MYHWEDKNLGFIAHPRTASSATQRALRSVGARILGNHHEVKPEWCQAILETGGIIMSTIRNPFDLFVSWYFHYKRKDRLDSRALEYPEWLKQFLDNKANHYVRQGLFFGLRWTNRILRFENLQTDFDRVMIEIGAGLMEIEPINVSRPRERRHYREFYDDVSRRLIEDSFGAELQEHGYAF